MSAQSSFRFETFVRTRRCGLAVAALAFAAIAIYVFALTPYQNFLYSDMRGFWIRAMDRLAGKEQIESQFEVYPPLGHIFIAELFKFFQLIGLKGLIKLETLLVLNMTFYAGSVYAFHRLVAQWFARPSLLVASVLIYAFGFPAFYFHAFLLSENAAAPLLVIALAVAACGEGWSSVAGSGLIFGLAAMIRPSLGPYGLAFVLMYFARYGVRWLFVAKAAAFTAAFFFMVFIGIDEVDRISGGELRSLSGNGGLDFFIATSKCHRVELNYDGWNFFVVVPEFSLMPENGTYYFNVPFYRQSYYFNQAWNLIKQRPSRLLENFVFIKDLFFARMMPSRFDAPGFSLLMPVWDWLKFFMFLSLGLYAWTWRDLGKHKPLWAFLMSLAPLTIALSFFFTGEPRYTYTIMFAANLLSLKLAEGMIGDNRRIWLRRLGLYAAGVAAAAVVIWAAVWLAKARYPATVSIAFRSKVDGAEMQSFEAGRLLFPYQLHTNLKHADVRHRPLTRPAVMSTRTRMEIAGPEDRDVQFHIYSSWPVELRIDGHTVTQDEEGIFVKEFLYGTTLTPGVHEIETICTVTPQGSGGFVITYTTAENSQTYRSILGVDAGPVHFLPLAK